MWPIPPYTTGTYIVVLAWWIAIGAIILSLVLALTVWKKTEVLE